MRERTAPLCHRTRRTPVNNHESIHQRRGRSLYFPSSRGQLFHSQYCSVDCGWKAAGWAAQPQELISLFTLWFYLDLHFLCPLYLKGSHHPSDCSVGCFLFFSAQSLQIIWQVLCQSTFLFFYCGSHADMGSKMGSDQRSL